MFKHGRSEETRGSETPSVVSFLLEERDHAYWFGAVLGPALTRIPLESLCTWLTAIDELAVRGYGQWLCMAAPPLVLGLLDNQLWWGESPRLAGPAPTTTDKHTSAALAASTESLQGRGSHREVFRYRTESPQQVSTVRHLWFLDTMQLREVGNVAVYLGKERWLHRLNRCVDWHCVVVASPLGTGHSPSGLCSPPSPAVCAACHRCHRWCITTTPDHSSRLGTDSARRNPTV